MAQVYCVAADLPRHFPRVAAYDQKMDLPEERFVVHSGQVYKLYNSGQCAVLFIKGEDQGAAVANVAAISADWDWVYVSADDALYIKFATGEAPTDATMRIQAAPYSWANLMTAAIQHGAELVEATIDNKWPRPFPRIQTSKTSGVYYDWFIVKANALAASLHLVESTAPASDDAKMLRDRLGTPVGGEEGGLLDLINSGALKGEWELTSHMAHLEEVTVDSTTTGYPTEPLGKPAIAFETFLIKIGTGGTLTAGTKNSVLTYTVTDSQAQTIIAATVITGYHQTIGGGISARFVPGVYVANDQWNLTVKAEGIESTVSKSLRMTRRG